MNNFNDQDEQKRKEFVMNLCEEFKLFCADSIDKSKDIDDHFLFMQLCLDLFIEMKTEEYEYKETFNGKVIK